MPRIDPLDRITAIDAMFASASNWGSWMVSAANEREALVNRFRVEDGVFVDHKFQARTQTGGRVS